MSKSFCIASDHAGLGLKSALSAYARDLGYTVEDLGTQTADSCDYPDFAHAVAERVLKTGERGVLICGSGIGMSIAANRHSGIRAALCRSGLEAQLARRHNDANVLCLGERISGIEVAKECLERFLSTEFEGGRHQKRVAKLEEL